MNAWPDVNVPNGNVSFTPQVSLVDPPDTVSEPVPRTDPLDVEDVIPTLATAVPFRVMFTRSVPVPTRAFDATTTLNCAKLATTSGAYSIGADADPAGSGTVEDTAHQPGSPIIAPSVMP